MPLRRGKAVAPRRRLRGKGRRVVGGAGGEHLEHARSNASAAPAADAVTDREAPVPREAPRPAFATGAAVRVPRYGSGVVASADAQSVTVRFPNGSTRCFLAQYVKARKR